jgi:cyclophilin family peptidyl-prolyl cis-trans isomerase
MTMRHPLITLALLCCVFALNAQEKRARLIIETDSGSITVELYNETPLHRDNFLKLAKAEFYNGTTFHRVIEDFMIQGGNPATKEGAESAEDGPGYTVPAEFNPTFIHKKGALCAARQGDNVNPKRASSGSQFYLVQGKVFSSEDLDMFEHRINQDLRNQVMQAFFAADENKEYLSRIKVCQQERNQEEMKAIMDEVNPMIDARMEAKAFTYTPAQRTTYTTLGGTPHLDMQYTIFGEVVEGLEVIDRIAGAKKERETLKPAIRMKVRVVE